MVEAWQSGTGGSIGDELHDLRSVGNQRLASRGNFLWMLASPYDNVAASNDGHVDASAFEELSLEGLVERDG